MIYFVHNQLSSMYDQYITELSKLGKGGQPFGILKDLHGLISGFKALTTWDGEKYSEILKQSCGGHGFM